MKKIACAIIALSALAFSCTKSNIVDVPETQKAPIAFDTYNGRIPVTKASEITKDNISEIQVYGFHAPANGNASYTSTYMDPEVSRTYDETAEKWGDWGYDPLSYWPASGTLEFVAHGTNTPRAESGAGNLVPVDGSYANFTYTVPTAAADQEDLIAGHVAATSATSDKVTFTMSHLLSRIGFTLMTLGTGSDVTINTIELHGNFINTGAVNLATTTPAINTDNYDEDSNYITNSYSLFSSGEFFKTKNGDKATEGVEIFARYTSDGNGGSTESTDNSNRYLMVIPGTIDKAIDADDTDKDASTTDEVAPYIKVVYQLSGASEQTAIIPFKNGDDYWTLAAGKAYEFVLTVSVAQIDFTGSVEPWDETTPETPIY